jgi:hypothetical protein
MDTIDVPKDKFGQVISDTERMITHFEELAEDQDKLVKMRLADIKEHHVQGKSEAELDSYLKKRGVKID